MLISSNSYLRIKINFIVYGASVEVTSFNNYLFCIRRHVLSFSGVLFFAGDIIVVPKRKIAYLCSCATVITVIPFCECKFEIRGLRSVMRISLCLYR